MTALLPSDAKILVIIMAAKCSSEKNDVPEVLKLI
jgi:hypothetical protein